MQRQLVLDPEYLECTRCSLSKLRQKVVPAIGPVERPDGPMIAVFGEGPGPKENRSGTPFDKTAPAGRTLTKLLKDVVGIDRSQVVLGNSVSCLPTDNGKDFRPPTAAEKKACRHWLDRTLEEARPDIILAVGQHALKSFVPKATLKKHHGLAWELDDSTKVIGLYHPSYYNRAPEERYKIIQDYKDVWKNLQTPVRPPELDWTLVIPKTVRDIRWLANQLLKSHTWAFDFETTGLDANKDQIVGCSFSNGEDSYYVDIRHMSDRAFLKHLMEPFFLNTAIRKLAMNVKFETRFLIAKTGVVKPLINYGDPQLIIYLVDQQELLDITRGDRSKEDSLIAPGLKEFVLRTLHVQMQELKDILGVGKKRKSILTIPPEIIGAYGAADSYYTYLLNDHYEEKLPEALRAIYEEVDLPLAGALARMEARGVELDQAGIKQIADEATARMAELQQQIYTFAGRDFTLSNKDELREILFTDLKLKSVKKTPKKQLDVVDKDVLEELADSHPIIPPLIEYNVLAKAVSTYTTNLKPHPVTGRVHTEFRQASTATNRLSSGTGKGGLNLQNIPARDEQGKRFRKLFIAPPGWVLMKADASQEELRILAHYIKVLGCLNDPLVQAFENGEDVHGKTAKLVFGTRPDFATNFKHYRDLSKITNFGIIYGFTKFGLAEQMHIEIDEAEDIIAMTHKAYPGIVVYRRAVERELAKFGYVIDVAGRRMPLPSYFTNVQKIKDEAVKLGTNYKIQGTGASIMRQATVVVDDWLYENSKLESYISHEVHDELVLLCRPWEVEMVAPVVAKALAPDNFLQVPLVTEIQIGLNWGELEDLEVWLERYNRDKSKVGVVALGN